MISKLKIIPLGGLGEIGVPGNIAEGNILIFCVFHGMGRSLDYHDLAQVVKDAAAAGA